MKRALYFLVTFLCFLNLPSLHAQNQPPVWIEIVQGGLPNYVIFSRYGVIVSTFDYNLNRTIAEIRPRYGFDVSCPGSVPEAIIAFLEGNSFEEVIRLAISLGGDSDTIGAMAGAIAACVYPIPDEIAERCDKLLTEDLREIKENYLAMIETR